MDKNTDHSSTRVVLRHALAFTLSFAVMALGVHADTLRIGISAPLTGIQGPAGQEVVAHLQAGIAELSKRNEFGDHRVELFALDDGYDVQRTVANVRQLVADKHVHLLMNQIGSAHAAAILPIVQTSGVTLFAPLSGPRSLYADALRPAVVPLRASYGDEVKQQIRALAATGVQSVSIVFQDDAFGQDVLKSWQEGLGDSGLKIASTHPLPRGSSAVEPLVDAALKSGSGAIVLAVVSSPALVGAVQIRQKAGSRVFAVLMSVAATSEVIDGLTGPGARGAVLFSSVMPIPTTGTNRLIRNYAELRKKYSLKPSFRGLEAYASLLIVAEQVRRMPRFTAQSLGAALASAPSWTVSDVYFGARTTRYAEVFAITKHGLL
ncbi:MAG: ABC transporter substrate-binding protein [Casimicrobium sp.]